jgi:hypothetical protein
MRGLQGKLHYLSLQYFRGELNGQTSGWGSFHAWDFHSCSFLEMSGSLTIEPLSYSSSWRASFVVEGSQILLDSCRIPEL